MKKSIILLFVVLVALALNEKVEAKGMPAAGLFGNHEKVYKLEDVKLKSAYNEDLFIGYKTSIYFFLAGVYIKDEGYVLGVKGDENRYYPYPNGIESEKYKKLGLLPSSLPAYSLSLKDYLRGYSLWIILCGIAVYKLLTRSPSKEKLFQKDQNSENQSKKSNNDSVNCNLCEKQIQKDEAINYLNTMFICKECSQNKTIS